MRSFDTFYNSDEQFRDQRSLILLEQQSGSYVLTNEAYEFLFRTKEIDSELDFSVNRFKLQEFIKRGNYGKALRESRELVSRVRNLKLTYYALSEKRGTKAMEEIGFLEKYKGIVVHDFWMSYFKATRASHAMCCAHLLRELTGISENHPELDSRNHYMECLKRNYDQILEEGVDLNPIPEKQKGRRGRPKRGKIRALIDRLREYKGEVCRFADNSLVPFTNNQAERDLRMVKLKNKVIGTFRSLQGAKDFLILKSLTSTASKTGTSAFDAFLSLNFGRFVLED